jgi:hypothetical protein
MLISARNVKSLWNIGPSGNSVVNGGANEDWGGQCPTSRGLQVRLLKSLTSPERAAVKAKCVTNVTYTLVESAY